MTDPTPLRSKVLLAAGFSHGFFTRVGGCSDSNYATLNCSYSVGDDAARVTANLARIASSLNIRPEQLVSVSQVHGATVEVFNENDDVSSFRGRQADALLSRSSNHGLAVRTADCLPILVGCEKTGIAAAIHAGWRGIVAGVIGRTIETLLAQGCRRESLVACVGPHIGPSAFEVSEEVAMTLQATCPDAPALHHVSGANPHVALGVLAVAQLAQSGLRKTAIEDLGLCTYTNNEAFFSYRRDGAASGRQLSVIRPH
jgi:YfiH family protein